MAQPLRWKPLLVATVLMAAPAAAEWTSLPQVCEPLRLPIATPEAAVCVAIDRVGRKQLDSAPWAYRYNARDSGDTWQVLILPAVSGIRGGDYTVDVQKKTGAVVGVLYGK